MSIEFDLPASLPFIPWSEQPGLDRPLTKAEDKACSREMREVAEMFREVSRAQPMSGKCLACRRTDAVLDPVHPEWGYLCCPGCGYGPLCPACLESFTAYPDQHFCGWHPAAVDEAYGERAEP